MFDDLIDDLEEVVLETDPYVVTATVDECLRRIEDRENQVGFWVGVLKKWEQEGRI